ncbi:cytochrome P450 [Streptomyces candidus]|uniref:Cytochrome P450 n=1 Tax=Streptomyces candidus TaxID=67283 RepID=A0A7X0LPL2_9ACTN|nr:cytochrome P450 [Streptomyces candidus]GHH46928.1 cytochrome P450 [Streptomyces candidus]
MTTPPPGCPAHAPSAADAFAETAVPLSGPRFQTDPVALYREMRREHGPVVPVTLPGDLPAWLVVGYRELHQVTSDPVLFSRDSELWNQWERVPADWPLLPMIGRRQPSILYTVGERHTRRARMVSDALEAVDPFELRRYAEQFADGLIDTFCTRGETDIVSQYAMLLPVRVLAKIYGIPDTQGPGLVTALNDMIDGRERALAGQQHVVRTVSELLDAKRTVPGQDVASRMLADADASGPDGFDTEDVLQDLMVMMAAGHQPTADWIGNTLRLMLTDDRFTASLSGGRHSVAEAMNEVLWEDTPSQNVAGRWAARDTRLGGRAVAAGDLLLLGLAAANGDPQIRTDASVLTGGNNAFLSFGHGEHRCPFPAQETAEVIARTAVEVLLDRLPDIDLAVPADALVRRPSPWLRGLSALPVTFTPTPALAL